MPVSVLNAVSVRAFSGSQKKLSLADLREKRIY